MDYSELSKNLDQATAWLSMTINELPKNSGLREVEELHLTCEEILFVLSKIESYSQDPKALFLMDWRKEILDFKEDLLNFEGRLSNFDIHQLQKDAKKRSFLLTRLFLVPIRMKLRKLKKEQDRILKSLQKIEFKIIKLLKKIEKQVVNFGLNKQKIFTDYGEEEKLVKKQIYFLFLQEFRSCLIGKIADLEQAVSQETPPFSLPEFDIQNSFKDRYEHLKNRFLCEEAS